MNKEKIKAVLFDMDGILIDSEPMHFMAHKKALEHFGVTLTLEDYMEFGIAKGDRNLYEKAAEKFAIIIDKNEISKLKKKIYLEIVEERGQLIDGVLEALEYLKNKYDLAIVSSGASDVNSYVVKKFKLESYFKLLVTGDDVEKVKPFPDIYLKAMGMLNYVQEDCIAIEDSETGVSSAKSAGIECIAIPNHFTKSQDLSHADAIISKITALKELL